MYIIKTCKYRLKFPVINIYSYFTIHLHLLQSWTYHPMLGIQIEVILKILKHVSISVFNIRWIKQIHLNYLLGLHCTDASPVIGLGHSHTMVRKGNVFATRHIARSPQDVGSHGFLQLFWRHARSGPQSASFSHSTRACTKRNFFVRILQTILLSR